MALMESVVLENLVRLRKSAGLSQKQVESQLGLRGNTLYDIEKGRLKLPFMMAVELVQTYHAQLDDLLESEPTNENAHDANEAANSTKPVVSSLEAIGVIDAGYHPLAMAIAQDPVIVAEVGFNQIGRKPLMDLLMDQMTSTQQHAFVMDVYRYINSLISSDGVIRDAELQLRDMLMTHSQIKLSDSDKKASHVLLRNPTWEKPLPRVSRREAYKHFFNLDVAHGRP